MSAEAEEPLVRSWERLLKDHYREDIQGAYLDWPKRSSVLVDFFRLQSHDEMLAEFTLRRPHESLAFAQAALKLVDLAGADVAASTTASGAVPKVRVRVVNLPADARVGVAELRMEHAGRLVSVNGVLQAVASPTMKLVEGLFVCMRCGQAIRVRQDEHMSLVEPTACPEDQGGCGRDSKSFKFIEGDHKGQRSVFTDLQVGILQEPPESIQGARPPVRVPIFVEEDLCGSIMPSDRVRMNAVVRAAERRVGNKKTTMFDYFLEVVSIEREARDYDEIEPTPEELVKFQELAASETLREYLVENIAPTIYGRREVKLAILLQLFGGVPKDFPNGRHIRGDIHVLLVGDPGVAKSVMGKAAAILSPRGQFANALTATVAGVVGGVEKVERSLAGEGWVYQAGLASMCHRGFLYLDEVDKPRDEGLHGALLEPLEQQTASLNKHGARGIMVKTEFAFLGGCNPKGGRFVPGDTIEQIELPRPFMDRMDLVFAIRDVPDEANDARLVGRMLRVHAAGSALRRGDATREDEAFSPNTDFLRKYIAFAKRTVFPELPPEVAARITAKYTTQRRRRSPDADSPVGYSPRTVDTLVRISEAAARMRLSNVVTEEDLTFAMDVYNAGWEQLATNEKGQLDADRLGATPSFDQRERMRLLKAIIHEMTATEGVQGDEVVAEAMRRGIPRETAFTAFGRWKLDSTLMERSHGRWVLTNDKRCARPECPRCHGAPAPASSAPPPSGGGSGGVRWS